MKVLDAGTMIAGPMAACLLGDYGAEVIKIEHPALNDPLRDWEPSRNGISLWWKVLNRNKQMVTLDLASVTGQELFKQLAAWADVVVENFRPGTFERWNLSYSELSAVNPGLVLVRVSGYGQTGPYARRPGYGTIAEAMSGVPSFTGAADGPPTLPGFPLADSVAAVFAALAAVAALRDRDRATDHAGQEIDVSLFEPLFRLVDSQVIGFDQLGAVKTRIGNRLAEDAPRNTYRTRDDRWVALSASSNRTFGRLVQALGQPELAKDPRFGTSSMRVTNAEALDTILADWFAQRTCDGAMRQLQAYDVVAGPVYDIRDIFSDPHYRSREAIVEVPDPDFGSVRMQAVIPKFGKTPGRVRFTGARPGAHNQVVFSRVLQLDAERIAALRADGVI